MKRLKYKELLEWKNDKARKPLVIMGARQVGKTYLIKDFGNNEYEKVAYFSFDNNDNLIDIFNKDYDIERILRQLGLLIGFKIENNCLIIFDEIQYCERAITALKYFCEARRDLHIIAAGSLLGIKTSSGTGFPVGKVNFLYLYPLNFIEFLMASNEEMLLEILEKKKYNDIKLLKDKIEELLKIYFYVGGMPEVVNDYIQNKDFERVNKIQKEILKSYDMDFSKHLNNQEMEKARMIFNSIPSQLSKENKKFIYGAIKTGSRAKDYENAIMWLKDAGLIYTVHKLNKAATPIKSYEDFDSFKMYLFDIGLLLNMCNVPMKYIVDKDYMFVEFKGSLVEEFVLTELKSKDIENIMYWSNDTSRAEVDFIIEQEGKVIPIEVKSGINLKAKSFNNYIKDNNITYAVRTSLADYKMNDIIEDIPLYCLYNSIFNCIYSILD